MGNLLPDYLVLCYLTSLGVLQIAAAYGGLRGLLLLRRPVPSVVLGGALVLAGFLWFFRGGPRLVPDTVGGLDGNQQALYFTLSAFAAVVTTLLLSSVVNHRSLKAQGQVWGLEALREATYLQAVQRGLKGQWKRWPMRTWRFFSGSTAG